MPRRKLPLTDYPVQTRRVRLFYKVTCDTCGEEIVIGERYYAKSYVARHERCAMKDN